MVSPTHIESHKNRVVVGLYGTGGFAREVMPFLRDQVFVALEAAYGVERSIFFVETEPSRTEVNGYPLISDADFFGIECPARFFNVAIGDSRIRQRIADACIARGAKPFSLRSPNAIAYDANEIGEGAILCANTVVTSNAKIGRFFHANIFSYIAHDCVIGDFATFAPNVHCNGNVHIHDHAYIGTGAIIKQGTPARPLVIGEGAIVGMGSVVTKNVEPFTTVVGNPARPLERHRGAEAG
jgi:sugar O-acyltransferase (sialic acid O-acetyltransferase NeuD family)